MAESEGALHRGNTMKEFERLRKQSSSSSDSGRLHWTKDAELLELEQEYNKLLKQKEALSKRVEETSLLNQLQYYVEQQAEGEFAPLGDLASQDNLFKAIELLKKRKLMETYNMYRLSGLAFVLLDDNRVRFCLDTFYKGQYFEPFYIEIQLIDEKIKILNHTIPFFIPIEEIHQKYETSADIKDCSSQPQSPKRDHRHRPYFLMFPESLHAKKEFLSILRLYLKAFVTRRQQCVQIKEEYENYSVENFYATPAFNFVKFALKFSSDDVPKFDVKLKYSDLSDILPKEVDVKCSDRDSQDILAELQSCLLSLEIKEAFEEVFAKQFV